MNRNMLLVMLALLVPVAPTGCDDDAGRVLDPGPTGDPAGDPAPPISPAGLPPRADAGPDLRYVDLDEDGLERVVLDGCGCEAGGSPIASYRWTEGQVQLVGAGDESRCTLVVNMNLGRHFVTLTITDAAGRTASDVVAVDVKTRYPVVSILGPREGAAFATGSEVRFSAVAADWRGAAIEGDRLVWESSLDGQLGSGAEIARSDLSKGDHAIRLIGEDSDGYVGTATLGLRIADGPAVTILSPADGSSYVVLEDVTYQGECVDGAGSPVTGNGILWNPRPCMADPHEPTCGVSYYFPGSDVTTFRCTDANGLSAEASVTIDVYVSYERNIEPYPLGFGCTECHGADRQEGGIRLDTYQQLTTGGNSNGPLIVAGDAGQGILIPKLLAHHHDPDRESLITDIPWVWLPLESIEHWWTTELLADWIDDGALEN